MKLVLVTRSYFPAVGGIEAHVRQLAYALAALGHETKIVAGTLSHSNLPQRLGVLHESVLAPRSDAYVDHGIPVMSMGPSVFDRFRLLPAVVRTLPLLQRYAYHGLNRFAYRWGYSPVYVSRLRKQMVSADLVHVLAGGTIGWASAAAARSLKLPVVVTPFVHPHQWGDGPDDIAYYQKADAVIGLLDTDTAYLASIGVGAAKLHTIGVSPDLPPRADPAAFRGRYQIGDAPMVLYLGRMMPKKGAPAVVHAATRVWVDVPKARFVFIGPASADEAALFTGADPRLSYLGKVTQQEKADALAACDVFCMPSLSELVGTVYLEAWSYGKPVVAGMAPGLRELVEGSHGGVVVEQDGSSVAAALLTLLQDPLKRQQMGKAGKARVEQQYAVPQVTQQIVTLYQQIIDQHKDVSEDTRP